MPKNLHVYAPHHNRVWFFVRVGGGGGGSVHAMRVYARSIDTAVRCNDPHGARACITKKLPRCARLRKQNGISAFITTACQCPFVCVCVCVYMCGGVRAIVMMSSARAATNHRCRCNGTRENYQFDFENALRDIQSPVRIVCMCMAVCMCVTHS